MTHDETRAVLDEVMYLDWEFRLVPDGNAGHVLQVAFRDPDGKPWTGRKWKLSPHMTRSEIVQTAFKAVMTAIEHEAREAFTYRDRAIFGPHFDVDRLIQLVDAGAVDVRTAPQIAAAVNWAQL